MNIKAVFAGHVDVWDSRADGSAYSSHAWLRVRKNALVLYTELKFVTEYSAGTTKANEKEKQEPEGWPRVKKIEKSFPETVLKLKEGSEPDTLDAFLNAAHDELGLLRFDVDGETFYQYEEPAEDAEEDDSGGGETPFFVPSEAV